MKEQALVAATQTSVVLIPGWNEGADKMAVFVNGRRGLPGLSAAGFRCTVFDGGTGSLTGRIDQLSRFVAGLRAADSTISAVALFGYSAGGLIARGLVRAYPAFGHLRHFPVGGSKRRYRDRRPARIFRRIHFEQSVIEDMDVASPFMAWLNKTSGHWEGEASREKRWKLDKTPWVAPKDVPILTSSDVSPGMATTPMAWFRSSQPRSTICFLIALLMAEMRII